MSISAKEIPSDFEESPSDWKTGLFKLLVQQNVTVVGYVPDAGHADLINLCKQEASIEDIVLSTEEEGIGLAAGAWVGGKRTVLLMQSSGVGNIINAASMREAMRVPIVILVTMRGEYAEFNPWQVPMGRITEECLRLCGFATFRVDQQDEVCEVVRAAIDLSFNCDEAVAVLLSQRFLGRKVWQG